MIVYCVFVIFLYVYFVSQFVEWYLEKREYIVAVVLLQYWDDLFVYESVQLHGSLRLCIRYFETNGNTERNVASTKVPVIV